MNVSKEQEIKNVIKHIEESVWNGKHNDSRGYVIDLNNTKNKIEISATIEETVHKLFTTEPHLKIEETPVDLETAISKYLEMEKPYIFNLAEYNNLLKLKEDTQKIFLDNLLEIETKLSNIKNNEIITNSLRQMLLKKETEKERLYTEMYKTENEYVEKSEKKEQNLKKINDYLKKIKRNNKLFRPINIINKLFLKQETEKQNKFYKSEAVKLERENIKNTELIFEKMFYKNDLIKQIKNIEKEIEELRNQYKLENKEEIKELDILKEKNMLFKVFGIDRIEEIKKEKENGIEEHNEN